MGDNEISVDATGDEAMCVVEKELAIDVAAGVTVSVDADAFDSASKGSTLMIQKKIIRLKKPLSVEKSRFIVVRTYLSVFRDRSMIVQIQKEVVVSK